MSHVVIPAGPPDSARAVAPLRRIDGDHLITALHRSALDAQARGAPSPPPAAVHPAAVHPAAVHPADVELDDLCGEVVLRDGARLRFGRAAGWRGAWVDDVLIVRPAHSPRSARKISLEAISGGRVELWLGAPSRAGG